MADDDLGASTGAWFDMVRRARLDQRLKSAALVLGSYANADGRGIYCGTARLALDLDCGYSTARRYVARLRDIGLIQLVRRVRQAGMSDEYRLIIGPDVLEHIEVPDPELYKSMANKLKADQRRGRTRLTAIARTAHSDERYEAPPEHTHVPLIHASGTHARTAHESVGVPLTANAVTSTDRDTTCNRTPTRTEQTSNEAADARTDVTASRAQRRYAKPQISKGEKCPACMTDHSGLTCEQYRNGDDLPHQQTR